MIENAKKINILNDVMFKSLFRSVEARFMFSKVLSILTGIDEGEIFNAKFDSSELTKIKMAERGKIADIIVCIDEYNKIIIENNQFNSDYIFVKNTSYAFSTFLESTKVGSNCFPRIILISIDRFNKFKTDAPILKFGLRDSNGYIENEAYVSIHLILENIINSKYNINEDLIRFGKFLLASSLDELESISKGDNDYMAAFRKVEDLSSDPELIGYYDLEEARKFELEDLKSTAIRIGKEEGREEGIREGREEGREEGIEQTKKEMILNMHKKGLDIDTISEVSELSIDEVNEILNANI